MIMVMITLPNWRFLYFNYHSSTGWFFFFPSTQLQREAHIDGGTNNLVVFLQDKNIKRYERDRSFFSDGKGKDI